jgi:ethanolamine ammonia-lyase small subunit
MTRISLPPKMSMRGIVFLGAGLAFSTPSAQAREIHLDCARTNQSVMIDIDTDRLFMQLMWSEGVAEEYKDGDSYISGPDSFGRKEKVVYSLSVDKDLVRFGQDRICEADGSKSKCVDQHIRNTLDVLRGELKYSDVDTIIVLKCIPAPPGRRF